MMGKRKEYRGSRGSFPLLNCDREIEIGEEVILHIPSHEGKRGSVVEREWGSHLLAYHVQIDVGVIYVKPYQLEPVVNP